MINLLEEYKELYYKEIEHSERLNDKINNCITFITVLGSAQVLLWSQLKNFELRLYTLIYLILCIFSLVIFIVCIFYFYHAYSGYKYNYFPIKDMAVATVETYDIAGDDKEDIKRADKHIYDMYCERYLNDAIKNRDNNALKNNRYRQLSNLICAAFILTIFVYAFGVGIDYYESKTVVSGTNDTVINGGEDNGG